MQEEAEAYTEYCIPDHEAHALMLGSFNGKSRPSCITGKLLRLPEAKFWDNRMQKRHSSERDGFNVMTSAHGI